MKTILSTLILITLISFGPSQAALGTAHYKGPEMESLPDAVQKAIKSESRGSRILCIAQAIDEGQTFYNVELLKSDREFSFEVNEEGIVMRIQVALEETPELVQKAIKTEAGSGSIHFIDKIPDEDTPTFIVEMTKDGHDRTFTVSEDGEMISREVFLNELPETIQKAIKTQAGSGRVGTLSQIFEDEEMSYSVELTRHRKSVPFTLDDEGNLLNAVVTLEDTPEPVQKAIRSKIADAYLEQITLYVKDGHKTYEVTYTRADAVASFEVTSEGKIILTEEPSDGVPRVGA
jgi:uncharacterized membrane protein YkoI